MTSVISQGKYRQRKEWSTNSIPGLMSLEEETNPDHHQNDDDIITPVKPPRRGSLAALGIFAGRNVNQEQRHTKRRSSIAEAILGRSHKVQ